MQAPSAGKNGFDIDAEADRIADSLRGGAPGAAVKWQIRKIVASIASLRVHVAFTEEDGLASRGSTFSRRPCCTRVLRFACKVLNRREDSEKRAAPRILVCDDLPQSFAALWSDF